jgi:pSer/pThr/pTyr-binding forkhead associated (FHA) protein
VGKGYRFIAPQETDDAGLKRVNHRLPNYVLTRGTRQFVLDSGQNLLGRDPDATVYIDHPSVSRRHARVSIDSARAVVEDLKSRNGTFLDGRRIEIPTEIQNGAIIGLGPITLTFVVLSAGASTLPMGDSAGPARKPNPP